MSLDPKSLAEYKSNMEDLFAQHVERLWSVPAPDFGSYKERVGYIRGIKEHLEQLAQAESSQYRRDEPETVSPAPKRYED
jgi:hypothetical protein